MAGGLPLLAALALSLSGCGSSEEALDEEAYASVDADDDDSRASFDEEVAREAAQEELASETYKDAGAPYGCTEDCSGHNAGWDYAANATPDGGTSNSSSFDEGQQAYSEAVDERVQEIRDDSEDGETDY